MGFEVQWVRGEGGETEQQREAREALDHLEHETRQLELARARVKAAQARVDAATEALGLSASTS